jgi:dTDP-4-dehydrorhamnose 3,5-epimerase
MRISALDIDGAWVADSPIWSDDRGYFREWFKSESIKSATGLDFGIEQANISSSSMGTLRGIHYSIAPRGQAKWVTCVSGAIKDVIVDIRPKSPTFGKWVEVELGGNSGRAVFVGAGLGHGFIALKDNTTVAYLVSTPYSPEHEFEINPLDEKIGINWGIDIEAIKISAKDKNAPGLLQRLAEGKLPND